MIDERPKTDAQWPPRPAGGHGGPLTDLKVIEIGSLGPGPFAAMMLADLGADVVRVDRVAEVDVYDQAEDPTFVMRRGRPSIAVNLKHPEAISLIKQMVAAADVLLEGFRPGVMERLGLGPDVLADVNPALIYARMTGWGQSGPWAQVAGHDINYIAMAGPLQHFGDKGQLPQPPLNLLGDFGGGGMLLAFGVVSAVLEARASGRGQVVDAAMVDGTAILASMFYGHAAEEMERGRSAFAGGRHWYSVYETSDEKFMAVGALEPQFYDLFIRLLGLDPGDFPQHGAEEERPTLRDQIAEVFRSRTRAQWVEVFAGADACVTPVLSLDEASRHEHQVARGAFFEIDGVRQPAPAPRFSRTATSLPTRPSTPGEHTQALLHRWGYRADEVAAMTASGVVR